MGLNQRVKLVWLGVKSPSISTSSFNDPYLQLQNLYSFSEIQDKFTNDWSSYSDYKSDVDASNRNDGKGITNYFDWEQKLKKIYNDWGNHEDHFVNQYNSYSDFRAEFSEDKQLVSEEVDAGVRIFDTKGETEDGITAPAGSVEIFGEEIHFSDTGGGSRDDQSGDIVVDNISASNHSPDVGVSVTISADVTNNSNTVFSGPLSLYEDGFEFKSNSVVVNDGESTSIEFTVTKNEPEVFAYRIATSNLIEVQWYSDSV